MPNLCHTNPFRLFIVGLLCCDGPPFEFPYIPDLRLRCADILEGESELQRRDPSALEAFTLTEPQFEILRNNKVWQPSKLAWPDKVAATLDSHYSVSVSRGASQLVPRPYPHRPRRFTALECARLRGFPAESLVLGGPEPGQGFNAWFKSCYRMLGNAICPPVVAAIGGAVMAQLQLKSTAEPLHGCWNSAGRAAALGLALQAVTPERRPELLDRFLMAQNAPGCC